MCFWASISGLTELFQVLLKIKRKRKSNFHHLIPVIYLFSQQVFIEYLLHAWLCYRCRRDQSEQNIPLLGPRGQCSTHIVLPSVHSQLPSLGICLALKAGGETWASVCNVNLPAHDHTGTPGGKFINAY